MIFVRFMYKNGKVWFMRATWPNGAPTTGSSICTIDIIWFKAGSDMRSPKASTVLNKKIITTTVRKQRFRKSFHVLIAMCVQCVLIVLINPRRACVARVTVLVCVSVCVSVSTYSRTTGTKLANERYQRI